MRAIKGSKVVAMLTFAAILVFGSGLGVAAQDVRYNFDRDADFSKYKTYKWVDIPGAQKLADLGDRQFKAAMDAELAKKGLTKVDSDSADLLIGYQTAVQQEQQFNSYGSGYGTGPWRRGVGATGMSTTTTNTIHVGTIDVDMYDAAKKELVWEGMAGRTIDPKANPDKQQKNLEKAVAKLLKNYPPPQKKK